jgi:hypothetical protein
MDEVPWYVSLVASWLPFLVLIAATVGITLTIRTASRTKDGRSLAQVLDEHARELRRSNELLEEAIRGQRERLDLQNS